jgi:hypothetical protein
LPGDLAVSLAELGRPLEIPQWGRSFFPTETPLELVELGRAQVRGGRIAEQGDDGATNLVRVGVEVRERMRAATPWFSRTTPKRMCSVPM